MSDLGALSLGLVFGLCMVGAVLLRNEQEIREAWWRWRGIDPEAHLAEQTAAKGKAPIKLSTVVGFGLLTIAWIGLAVVSGDVFQIILAALYLVVFCVYVRKYRRSQRTA